MRRVSDQERPASSESITAGRDARQELGVERIYHPDDGIVGEAQHLPDLRIAVLAVDPPVGAPGAPCSAAESG